MDTAKVKQLIDSLADHLDVETNSYAEDLIESLRKEVLPAPVNANPEQPQAGDKPGEYGEPWIGTPHRINLGGGLLVFNIAGGGRHVAVVSGPNVEATVGRIVACVNACRGMPTEWLEGVVGRSGSLLLEETNPEFDGSSLGKLINDEGFRESQGWE